MMKVQRHISSRFSAARGDARPTRRRIGRRGERTPQRSVLSAGGRKYDDVTQVSKPAVSRISKSASALTKDGLPTGKSAIQQVWKPALQNTSPNLRPGALSRGFTLVEVILAIGIAIGILMVALYLHSQATNLRAQLLRESERIAAMRLVMDRLTSELRNAFAQPQYGFRGDATSLRFVTTEIPFRPMSAASSGHIPQTGPLTDLRLVSYGLSRTIEGTNEVATGLVRTEQLLIERPETRESLAISVPPASAPGTHAATPEISVAATNSMTQGSEPITEIIRLLRLWYWDGSDWSETWESSDLPRGVEITLAADPWPREASLADYPGEIFRRTIYLPTSREIETVATESGSSSNTPKP